MFHAIQKQRNASTDIAMVTVCFEHLFLPINCNHDLIATTFVARERGANTLFFALLLNLRVETVVIHKLLEIRRHQSHVRSRTNVQ